MPHPAFVASLERALVYEVLAFLAVAGLVVFLKKPAAGSPADAHMLRRQEPVAAEI